MTSGWLTFWDRPHSIYVNARHKKVHYRLLARQIAALVPCAQARVLDYGSGEALHAELVAATAAELLLCDGAPGTRAGLAARFAESRNIRVLAPEDVARLLPRSLDLIVLHSVAQYLTSQETDALFALFHRLLKPHGLLVVSDIIPADVGPMTDAWALLRFAAANEFFIAGCFGLLRMLRSDYRRLRSRLGLRRYADSDMVMKLASAGFSARRAAKNLGHNQARAAYQARPR